MKQKITTEIWIEKARKVHGDLYDYSESVYIDNKTKIKIICKEHGPFWQRPSNHVSKHYGCPKCKGENSSKRFASTKEEFVEKAKTIHGDKYDYSKVVYINNRTKVCIICPQHGEFWQTPANHINIINKSGCYKCGRIKAGKAIVIPLKEQIKKAKQIHKNKYDYSLNNEEFVKATDRIKIICPIHGVFEQIINNHMKGEGCFECGKTQSHDKQRLSNEGFIKQAVEIHGNTYDYSCVNYKKYHGCVDIICKKHGIFSQNVCDHLKGAGCPKCKRSRGEEIVSKTLTELNIEFIEQYKIKINSRVRNECVIDFYLPKQNTFIEFNGIQHYRPINFFGGQQQLNIQKERDEDVEKYCKENNIKLITISYKEEKIKESLKSKLYEKG